MSEKELALRFNNGKPKWSLVHYDSLVPMIRVLEFGEEKYGAFNWQKPGLKPKEVLESLQRHLASLMDGEDFDKESGMHHIGHIMANALMYSYHNVINKNNIKINNNETEIKQQFETTSFRDGCY